jgi:Ca2+-binding RTX toxin-like protein
MGFLDGIQLFGNLETAMNSGEVAGLTGRGVFVGADAANALLVNSGSITGADKAVWSLGDSSTIVNLAGGTLEATNGAGVEVDATDAASVVSITNYGTIAGTTKSIDSFDATDLTNTKTGDLLGNVELSDFVDNFDNWGTVDGNVFLFAADDVYRAHGGGEVSGTVDGGGGDDLLIGGREVDNLFGNDGKDTLKGGAGDDFLTGGLLGDKMSGGAGADTFVYSNILESRVTGRDTITDFSHAEGDVIDLTGIDADKTVAGNQAFIFDGTSAVVAAGHLSFSVSGTTATVKAYVDAGTAVDFQITLTHLTTLTADDFML